MAQPKLLAKQSATSRAALKERLDRLYGDFGSEYLASDPLAFVHRYREPADQEIVGFLASALAFGNVLAIQKSVEGILGAIEGGPSRFVDRFDPVRDGLVLAPFYHRWIRSEDLVAFFWTLRRMRKAEGSIGGFFLSGYDGAADDIGPSLVSFASRARKLAAEIGLPGRAGPFFSSPDDGSACKRINLYLRWMVRGGDGLDLGLWPGVSRSKLVLPLDTHLARLSRALGLTRRKSPGWAMAVEATRSLALLDPEDPVKYDFSLSRLGILDLCVHGRDPVDCDNCPIPRVRLLRG